MDLRIRTQVVASLRAAAGALLWAKGGPDVQAWGRGVEKALGLRAFDLYFVGDKHVRIHYLVVPPERRGEGLGSKAMKLLTEYADRHGFRVSLTPATRDKQFGTTSRARLVRFYGAFGFVENKGEARDPTVKDALYRDPR